ncbi:MAG: hypothetical protein RSC06_15820 [Clostridia bacterium]
MTDSNLGAFFTGFICFILGFVIAEVVCSLSETIDSNPLRSLIRYGLQMTFGMVLLVLALWLFF